MKTKRFLSLFVCMLMLLSSLGVFTASAETTETVLNVGKGITYALPTTLDDVTVTWTNNKGVTVTQADTSLVGVRYYYGTAEGATEPAYKYQINVGEYKVIMKDDFSSYATTEYTDAISASLTGGKFEKFSYTGADSAAATEGGPRIVKDGDNAVLELGPYKAPYDSARWTPDKTDRKAGDAFKLSVDLKLASFDPATSSATTAYLVQLRPKNMSGVWFRVKTGGTPETVTNTQLYSYFGTGGTSENIDAGLVRADDGTYSMTSYKTLEMAGNNVQYSTIFDNIEIGHSQVYKSSEISNVATGAIINIAKNYKQSEVNGVVYADNITYSIANYPTEKPSDVSGISLVEGATAAQTTTVSLEMRDGNAQEFTVNYVADTSSAGTKTATGTIEGFDDTVTVTYNVVGVTSGDEINTFVGADAQLPNGTAVDTSKLGRKYYSVSGDNSITNYTVNVGGWDVKRSDDMSLHTNTTVDHDGDESTDALDIVDPVTSDGFQLTAYIPKSNGVYASKGTAVGVVAADPKNSGNAVLKLTGKNDSNHLQWQLKDGFEGSFKYSMRVKVVAANWNTGSRENLLRVDIDNTKGQLYSRINLMTPKSTSDYGNGEYLLVAPNYSNQQTDTKATTIAVTQNNDGMYETDWFDVVIIGKADTGTQDIYVNGTLTNRDLVYHDIKNTVVGNGGTAEEIEAAKVTDPTFSFVKMYKSDDTASVVYVDDVSVSSYYKYEGALPAGNEILVGKDKAAAGNMMLTFSNGAVKAIPATMPDLDTSKLGTVSTKAVLTGFDDKVDVNAKVCNYDVSSLAYKYGNEFTSAPLPGGTITSAQVTNMGGLTKSTAVFAWYASDDSLKSIRLVDISGVAEGKTETVSVGLDVPGEIADGELAVADGYVRVFILDDVTSICPVDLAETFDGFTYTSPRLFAAGDSTDQSYKAYRYPQAGVAQEYDHYFDVDVYNYSSSGKNTTTFRQELLWDKIISEAKSGDYVIIAFGHNDQSATTAADYEANIRQYVAEARAKGMNPILRNPIARRKEGINGTAYAALNGDNAATQYSNPALAGKMDALEKVATELNVPFIDMIDLSSKYLQKLNGTEGDATYSGETTDKATAKLYACDFCFSWDSAYASLRNWEDTSETGGTAYTWAEQAFRELHGLGSKQDNTHPTIYGANVWAQMIAKEIADKDLILSKYAINLDKTISYPTGAIAE